MHERVCECRPLSRLCGGTRQTTGWLAGFLILLVLYLPRRACNAYAAGLRIPIDRSPDGARPHALPIPWGGMFAHARAAGRGELQDCRLPSLCLRMRGGITAKKMAGLSGKIMTPELEDYLKVAIKGGLDDDNWTSDESALEDYKDWMKDPDFWKVENSDDDDRKPLDVPAAFQRDMQTTRDNQEAQRRGEIGPVQEEAALEEAGQAAKAYRSQKRVDLASAKKGDTTAQYNLGVYLMSQAAHEGENVRRAVRWFQKAARQGHPKAQYNLALCMLHGTGTPQVCVSVRIVFACVCVYLCVFAYVCVCACVRACLYVQTVCVGTCVGVVTRAPSHKRPQNQKAGVGLLAEASRNGNLLAAYRLALLYLHGLHSADKHKGSSGAEGSTGEEWVVKVDARKAVKNLARAAGGGVLDAQCE